MHVTDFEVMTIRQRRLVVMVIHELSNELCTLVAADDRRRALILKPKERKHYESKNNLMGYLERHDETRNISALPCCARAAMWARNPPSELTDGGPNPALLLATLPLLLSDSLPEPLPASFKAL